MQFLSVLQSAHCRCDLFGSLCAFRRPDHELQKDSATIAISMVWMMSPSCFQGAWEGVWDACRWRLASFCHIWGPQSFLWKCTHKSSMFGSPQGVRGTIHSCDCVLLKPLWGCDCRSPGPHALFCFGSLYVPPQVSIVRYLFQSIAVYYGQRGPIMRQYNSLNCGAISIDLVNYHSIPSQLIVASLTWHQSGWGLSKLWGHHSHYIGMLKRSTWNMNPERDTKAHDI